MKLIAELTMPNSGSWNGQWTGSTNTYTKVFSTGVRAYKKYEQLIGNHSYNFGDGWRANVEIRPAKHRERVTNKFCGYDWMVTSLKMHNEIDYDKLKGK